MLVLPWIKYSYIMLHKLQLAQKHKYNILILVSPFCSPLNIVSLAHNVSFWAQIFFLMSQFLLV